MSRRSYPLYHFTEQFNLAPLPHHSTTQHLKLELQLVEREGRPNPMTYAAAAPPNYCRNQDLQGPPARLSVLKVS
jgi:hypothetical protein